MFANQTRSDRWKLSRRQIGQWLPAFALAILFAAVPGALAQQQPAQSQPAAPPAQTTAPTPVPANQQTESEAPQTLHLLVGRSIVISSPARIKRVSLADSNIAEAIVVSPTQVLVNGKTPGGVSLIIWDESDQSQAFEVSVDIDVLGLSQKIHEVSFLPKMCISTRRETSLCFQGKISSAPVADKILEIVKGTTPKVTSLMQVPTTPSGEILLQVRFVEVNRSAISQLGVNILSLPGAKNVGTISASSLPRRNSQTLTVSARHPRPAARSASAIYLIFSSSGRTSISLPPSKLCKSKTYWKFLQNPT